MLFLKSEKHFLQPLFTHWKLLDPVLIKIYFFPLHFIHLIIIFFKKRDFSHQPPRWWPYADASNSPDFDICLLTPIVVFFFEFLVRFGNAAIDHHPLASAANGAAWNVFVLFFVGLVNSGLRWYLSASFDKLSKRCCSFWVAVSTPRIFRI